MNRLIPAFIIILLFSPELFSQRILFESDFETILLIYPDSLPSGWKKLDVDQNNPSQGWAVRDTNQVMGGNPSINRPRAHTGLKSLHISWLAGEGGNNLNDDWVWTDSLRIQNGDSLIWWMLIGSTPGIAPYLDSVQVWVCSAQNPNSTISKLATIKSNDSAGIHLNNNVWTRHKYNLSSFAGQRIYIAFRYYIPIQSALWCNIDDLFIGNHSAIGIKKISSELPGSFLLKQNYPNPFNPKTTIEFSVPLNDFILLEVYNSLGQLISTLVRENLSAGIYSTDFDASSLTSGVYFFRLNSSIGYSSVRKMVLIK